MYDISWDELLFFIEDVLECEMLSKNLIWKPVRNPNITRKFFTPAMGFTILEARKYWLAPPAEDNMDPLIRQLLSSSNACLDYVFGIGQEYFCAEEFSWQNFRIFLAFIGEVAAYAVCAGRVLLVDDLALSTALYIKDYLMGWMERFGGWRTFQVDCVRSVMHVSLINQLLENEAIPLPALHPSCPATPSSATSTRWG